MRALARALNGRPRRRPYGGDLLGRSGFSSLSVRVAREHSRERRVSPAAGELPTATHGDAAEPESWETAGRQDARWQRASRMCAWDSPGGAGA